MKTKALVLILIAIGLVVVGVSTASRSQKNSESPPSRNRLQWYAQEAKQKGHQKVTIPAPIVEYLGSDGSTDVDKALASYTVVVAQLVEKRAYPAENDIVTWNRFRIVEALTKTRPPVCLVCPGPSPPPEMLPLNQNEFLLATGGGKFIIDAVEIEEESAFPEFRFDQNYVLLVSLAPSAVAIPHGGPLGVFTVDETGTLTSASGKPDILKEGLEKKFQNSLIVMKKKLTP